MGYLNFYYFFVFSFLSQIVVFICGICDHKFWFENVSTLAVL